MESRGYTYSNPTFGSESSHERGESHRKEVQHPTPEEARMSSISYESRDVSNSSSESRMEADTVDVSDSEKMFGSLDSIDKMIDKMEKLQFEPSSEEGSEVLGARKEKLKQLRQLVSQAREAQKEQETIKKLNEDNNKLDQLIDGISRGLNQ